MTDITQELRRESFTRNLLDHGKTDIDLQMLVAAIVLQTQDRTEIDRIIRHCTAYENYADTWEFGSDFVIDHALEANTSMDDLIAETAEPPIDQTQFLAKNASGRTILVDLFVFEYVAENHHICAVGKNLYAYKDGYHQTTYGNTQVKSWIKECLPVAYVKSDTINRITNLFFQDEYLRHDIDDMNQQPKHWICFQNGFWDPIEQRLHPHSEKYLCTNQIPHEFFPDVVPAYSDRIESFLDFVAPGQDDREMLLQYFGYCCTADTRFQKFMILTGEGGHGKSVVLSLLEEMVGGKNMSSASLVDMQNRFNAYTMQGKILNLCGDIETGALEDVTFLKKLTGEDSLRIEPKGVDAYSMHLLTKLIFSANEVPTIVGENSGAFWRRVLILPMKQKPKQINYNLKNELAQDIDYLIYLCMMELHKAYQQGHITESAAHAEAKKQSIHDSSSVAAFIDDWCCVAGDGIYPDDYYGTKGSFLYGYYKKYCEINEITKPRLLKGFYKDLMTKGYEVTEQHHSKYVRNIAIPHRADIPPARSINF